MGDEPGQRGAVAGVAEGELITLQWYTSGLVDPFQILYAVEGGAAIYELQCLFLRYDIIMTSP